MELGTAKNEKLRKCHRPQKPATYKKTEKCKTLWIRWKRSSKKRISQGFYISTIPFSPKSNAENLQKLFKFWIYNPYTKVEKTTSLLSFISSTFWTITYDNNNIDQI